jgi:hypothetical protein
MLDERGVDWDYGITGATTTRFSVNGIDLTFTPMRDGLVCSTILTPEKVIAATLGRGECTDTGRYCFTCSQCGWAANEPRHVFGGFWPNYCPNCGRKVVDA